jgi:glycosyltransferase involved in cell wall biosynthesis
VWQGATIKIAIVTLSEGVADPRPYRLSQILAGLGHEVKLIGYPTSTKYENSRNWKYIEFASSLLPLRKVSIWHLMSILLSRKIIAAKKMLDVIVPININQTIANIEADCLIAMDYKILPAVAARAKQTNATLIYEAREYYQGQYANNFVWRLIFPRLVRTIEGQNISDCDVIFTVSNGIADLLQESYALKDKPIVVLGFAETSIQIDSSLTRPIRVIFHGNIDKRRDLKYFIKAMHPFVDLIRLDIRGNGSKRIMRSIRRAAKRKHVLDHLAFLEPVRYQNLLVETSNYHFGLIPWRNEIPQVQFAMPNKFFEYLCAGIPIICSDNSEISETVLKYDLGLTFKHNNPSELRQKISLLTDVEYQKLRSSVSSYVKTYGINLQKQIVKEAFTKHSK